MKIKTDKLNGDILIFLLLIPLVTGIVWYNYSFIAAISMLFLFVGMYCYFNLFLNITLYLKTKNFEEFKIKIILFSIFSIAILTVSYAIFGLSFILKDLLVTAVLFLVQLFFILKR